MTQAVVTKVTENRLRRVALRQGFDLHKSRARDPRHRQFGKFQLLPQLLTTREAKAIHGIDGDRWYTVEEVANLLDEPLPTVIAEENP